MAISTNKKIFIIVFAVIAAVAAIFIFYEFIFNKPVNPYPIANIPIDQKKQDEAIMQKTASLVAAKDPTQCDSVDKIVNGINYKIVCSNNIYYEMAADNLEYSACEKLIDMSVEDCQRRVMSLKLAKEKSITVCDDVPQSLKLSCFDAHWSFSAVDQKDPAICSKTSAPELNAGCQSNVLFSLVNQKEFVKCAFFTDSEVKSDCENYLKGKEGCVLIKNAMLKNICIRK